MTAEEYFNSGFDPVSVRSSGISLSRAQQSVNEASRVDEFTMTDEKVRQVVEHNFFLNLAKKIVNALLDFFNAGDALKAVFVKRH